MAIWKVVGVGPKNAPLEIDGVDVWKHAWAPLGECISISYPGQLDEKHSFAVHQIDLQGHSIRFASAEVSAGIFAFYQIKK